MIEFSNNSEHEIDAFIRLLYPWCWQDFIKENAKKGDHLIPLGVQRDPNNT